MRSSPFVNLWSHNLFCFRLYFPLLLNAGIRAETNRKAARAMAASEIGRWKKTKKLPSDRSKGCRKACSIWRPSTQARIKGARSNPYFLNRYPGTPKKSIISISFHARGLIYPQAFRKKFPTRAIRRHGLIQKPSGSKFIADSLQGLNQPIAEKGF